MSVRITSGTTNRTYLKNLNGSQYAMNQAMERVESGRDFQKVSENVQQGTRAISVRSRLYRNEQMTDNVNTSMEQLNMAETCLKEINDICSNVQSEMFKALNPPTLQAGRDAFLSFLDGAKDEIQRLANTKYNNKYVMGGVGVESNPFKPNGDGKMTYCWGNDPTSNIEMEKMFDKNQIIKESGSTISKSKEELLAEVENYYDSAGNTLKYTGDSYIDVGLDMSVAVNGKVAPKTAFRVTVDGVSVLGYGRTDVPYDDIKGIQAQAGATGSGSGSGNSESVSNNIYDMMTDMQEIIRQEEPDFDKLSAIMVNFKKRTEDIIAAESEIGVRTRFLETNLDRLEAENTSLKKMQKDIEGVDDATEITNFMSYQNAWNLVLQFGKNIVPKSLMDYVN
jgi:flagellar hook-associated protein 3 FlgL